MRETRRMSHPSTEPSPSPERAFGAVLRELRRARGLSQERLALEAGYDRSYVGELERGEKSPSLRTIFRLARAIGVSPSALLAAVEARLPPPAGGPGA